MKKIFKNDYDVLVKLAKQLKKDKSIDEHIKKIKRKIDGKKRV